jgi:hypothetical protein
MTPDCASAVLCAFIVAEVTIIMVMCRESSDACSRCRLDLRYRTTFMSLFMFVSVLCLQYCDGGAD